MAAAGELPTMRVKLRHSGMECVINVKDFKDAKHLRIEAKGNPTAPGSKAEPEISISHHTREEMSVMSLDKLKELPEAKLIDFRGTKGEIVDKLLSARARLSKAISDEGSN